MNLSQSIKEQIILLASFAGRDMNQMLLDGYMGALSDLDQASVLTALQGWLKTGKGFPYPADIRAKVMPEIDGKDEAVEVANLIVKCVGKYGYTNPDSAKNYMGDHAWEVVQRTGTWKHLCESITQQNESIIKAQLRDTAISVGKRDKRGELDEKPMLQRPTAVSGLISDTIKKLETT